MIRVLFVCLGNICRSPMAEAVFAHLVRDAGLENQIEIDSAGTGNWHIGARAHHGTLDVLQRNNVPYDGRARQIVSRDLDDFDYVITMDDSNLANVRALADNNSHVAPLLSFAAESPTREVPDPYFCGGFDGVYDLVRAGCEGLLTHIRREHSL
ncbi:MAG TPA: low molecular weight protein-tyrosine-phosphatase [Abditibacteriaceae bacterium]|jgi:protein-tyrosine phosphatase